MHVLQSVPHVVIDRLFLHGHLDAEGQEAKEGADPEQNGEAAEQLTAELDPLRGCGGRSQCVLTVSGQNLSSSGLAQALQGEQFLGMNVFLPARRIFLQHNGLIFTTA